MDAVIAVIPTLGLIVLFWFVLRAILHADRNERNAVQRLEREIGQEGSAASPPSGTSAEA